MLDTRALVPTLSLTNAETASRTPSDQFNAPPEILQGLLQKFVDRTYGNGFLELGLERDFDHGHLLYSAEGTLPFAILYHTQELSSGNGAHPLDKDARNWIQRIDTGIVEDARRYQRAAYPKSAYWNWFSAYELPRYKRHRTIVSEMLDPTLLKSDVAHSRQWQFTRVSCRKTSTGRQFDIRLPDRGRVCLITQLQ